MKTIIAGSRTITDYNELLLAIKDSWIPTTVISGCAKGVDQLGERWAKDNNVPLLSFPANWELYGKSAGYKRNEQMAENAEGLIALWDGHSKGTQHMIDIAKRKGLKVHIHYIIS
jgi:hypothetical protein